MKIDIMAFRNLGIFKPLRLLLFILAIFVVVDLSGQDRNLSSRFLTVKDGLPQGYVSAIVQDKAGFIWISTRNGLARYDGKKFKVFYHNPNDSSSIASNIITNLFLDRKNRLWIKYENAGLDLFYPETGKIDHFSSQPGFEILKNTVLETDGIYENIDGGILLNSFYNGLIMIPNKRTAIQYPLREILSPGENIFGVTQNNLHHIFILTDKFLYHLDEKQELIDKVIFTVPSSIKRSIQNRYGMLFQSDSILFISGLNGIVKYQVRHNNYTLISITPAVKKLRGNNKYSLAYLNKEEGTFIFSGSSKSYTFPTNADADITSLLDRSGILWIGTSGYGIQLINLRHNSFQYHKYKPPFTAFLIKNYLEVDYKKIPKSLGTASNIYNIRWTYDKKGTLWMSKSDPYDTEVMPVYSYANKQFSRPDWEYADGKKIKKNTIYGIATDSKNNLWILEGGYIISKLDPLTGVVQRYSPTIPFDIKGADLSLLIDRQDNFWIAGDYGLIHYREGMQNYFLYSIDSKNVFDKEANGIINIAEDFHNENKLWMGSFGKGLICFDKKQKKFTVYTKKDGLPDNTIYSVMADDSGYLWCSSNQGIFRFDTRNNKARKYTAENGAPDFEFNRFHHLRLPDGRFAFGGFDDYTVFNPLSLTDDTSNLNVAITSWKINNQPAEYGEQGSPLNQSINSLKEIRLTHSQNFLSFEFAALQYDQPEIYQYRYRLSGIDKDWVYAGNNNLVNYTALPPGEYNLSINAANAAGLWSNKIKELRITITPPWWKTWWFYSIIFIAVLFLIYAIYRYRLNQILKLQQVRNRIAKDLHDEIGSSLSTISIYAKVVQQQLKNSGDKTQPLLAKISDNANQVQDAMNDIVWSINAKNDELESIVNRMREHAIQLFEAKNYALHFSFDDAINSIKLDMEQRKDFYLIYKEALNNIVKYAEGKNVWISLAESQNQVSLTIKDDGKGFDITPSSGNGNGLHNMQSRARALKGKMEIISEKEMGTTVSLIFPNK